MAEGFSLCQRLLVLSLGFDSVSCSFLSLPQGAAGNPVFSHIFQGSGLGGSLLVSTHTFFVTMAEGSGSASTSTSLPCFATSPDFAAAVARAASFQQETAALPVYRAHALAAEAAGPTGPASTAPAAGTAASRAFLMRVDALSMRPRGRAEVTERLTLLALRGRLASLPPVRVTGATSVSALGSSLLAAVTSPAALPAAAASAFSRYKVALATGGQLPLPFTVEKVAGFLYVYAARWFQSSASLVSVVMHLEDFAHHFGFPWLSAEDTVMVERCVDFIEKSYPAETHFATTVDEPVVTRMLAHLDSLGKANVWAVQMAALVSISFAMGTRPSELLAALVRDLSVAPRGAGLFLAKYAHKTGKKVFDMRRDTGRAAARPGSPLCPVARLQAFLALTRPDPHARLFPRRDQTSGAVSGGALSLAGFKEAFQALAVVAGIENGASLVPRGMRGGSATASRLAGAPAPAVDARIGWRNPETQTRYVHGHVYGLALDAIAQRS